MCYLSPLPCMGMPVEAEEVASPAFQLCPVKARHLCVMPIVVVVAIPCLGILITCTARWNSATDCSMYDPADALAAGSMMQCSQCNAVQC